MNESKNHLFTDSFKPASFILNETQLCVAMRHNSFAWFGTIFVCKIEQKTKKTKSKLTLLCLKLYIRINLLFIYCFITIICDKIIKLK